MKTKTKIMLSLIFSTAFLLLCITPNAYAGSCQGGSTSGDPTASYTFTETCPTDGVNNLEFRAQIWSGDDCPGTYWIKGYRITVDCFPNVYCTPGNSGTEKWCYVDVVANGTTLNADDECIIKVEFWENEWNSAELKNLQWTIGTTPEDSGMPDFGWRITAGQLMIGNSDNEDAFIISDLRYDHGMAYDPDFRLLPLGISIPGEFLIEPAGVSLHSIIDWSCGYIYVGFTLTCGEHSVEVALGHQVQEIVGGIKVPVDKLGLLAPYIGLASTILVATAATAVYAKRVKRKEEK